MEFPKISTSDLAIGSSSAIIGGAVGYIAGHRNNKKRRKHKNNNSRKRTRKHRKLKFGSPAFRKKYLSHKVRRRKSGKFKRRRKYPLKESQEHSHRRIHYTKHGQPYIIEEHRAKFISRKSAKIMRKRKGGKY